MRAIFTKTNQPFKGLAPRLSAAVISAVLLVGVPALGQQPPAGTAPATAPPATATPTNTTPAAVTPATVTPLNSTPTTAAPTSTATPTEGSAPASGDPITAPTPSEDSSVEDLFAPDRPGKKPSEKPAPAADAPKNKNPIIYISDSDNGRVVVMQGIDGEGFTSVGLPGYGLGRFLRPAQIWVDYKDRVYVADSGNNRIIRIDQNGQPGWTEVDGLSEPKGVAVDGSGVYVSDTKANRIVIYDEVLKGAKVREVLTHPQLQRPTGLWIDGAGALYICCGEDPPGGRLMKTWVEKERRRWLIFEGEGLTGSRFLPASVVVTDKGGVKLLDISDQRLVTMQDLTGKRLKEDKFRLDPRWRLSRPSGMATDPEGHIFIADSGNDRIVELAADGSVIGEYSMTNDDPGTLLANPSSIFIYSPAPPPPPKEVDEKDSKGKKKPPAKPKKKDDLDLEFDGGL